MIRMFVYIHAHCGGANILFRNQTYVSTKWLLVANVTLCRDDTLFEHE
jgi:hypothetical protein